MGTTPTEVLAFPNISAIVRDNGTAEVVVAGNSRIVPSGESLQDLRNNALDLVVGEARTLQRPVRVRIEDPEGHGELIVHPDKTIESVSYETRPARRRTPTPETTPQEAAPAVADTVPATEQETVPAQPDTAAAALGKEDAQSDARPWPPGPAASGPVSSGPVCSPQPAKRRPLREAGSFLAAPGTVEPATRGIRGMLNNLGFSLAPSADELGEREDIRLASKHFAGTRTIAVVNQKGGSNKTPTVADLAAVFGRNGGSVVAWDNNPTTGTLGWRTEQGDHTRSALDVIAAADALLSPTAQSADINAFVHHQSTDKYDVLRSDEDVDGTHEVTAEEVDILHRVVSKYYRLILMDSGNNHRSAEWNRMIDHADQLVVPTTNEEDRVEAALLTLQGLDLKSERSASLAANAVVIVSERQKGEARLSQETADKFRPYVRDVVVVPFDPALKSGQIRFGALQPATRRAWLRAAAAVARGL
ncbi:MinD/ParA family ATP-binding protein [Arthrobacter crystallopoietes]|uniref:MinD-like ATPase involved in chromosome partitioning or flagellar assembly n=1 Tax=Crystallibacter crystallopoietes TaxID=37928 RepID=A0A1H1HZJ6_9MICC|nr:AAA family ATPase [Arthrobacter crystallopoietes]AUI53727.1 chromosome partitioning protein ParA [Arthrobacter crystallopoietes]SDR30901.1 MinD-like ATPase involved in chromosome partitioning or flagellar assembly [Arthrobacter crystallopoietes]